MKITKPDEKSSDISKLEEAVSKFEEQLKDEEEEDEDYYHLLIVGEYNREVCDQIQKLYTDAGWKKVICRTSSENGERGGLTGLKIER